MRLVFVTAMLCVLGIVALDVYKDSLLLNSKAPKKEWCQEKPEGVWLVVKDGPFENDREGNFLVREYCYKKSMKDALGTAQDQESQMKFLGVVCPHDTSCYHKLEKIY